MALHGQTNTLRASTFLTAIQHVLSQSRGKECDFRKPSCDSVCVCVSCTHANSVGLGKLKNAFTVWSNSQACRQIHMSEQVPWAFHVKGNVNRSGRAPTAAPFPGPSPGEKGRLDHPAVAWVSGGRKCSSFQQGQTLSLRILPFLFLPSSSQLLVVHQRLDFVHQLTCYLQDMLDIVPLSHFCGSDRLLERPLPIWKYSTVCRFQQLTDEPWNEFELCVCLWGSQII